MDLAAYRIADEDAILTPALAIYPDMVTANIDAALRLMLGDANRWRPHVKTAKLGFVMKAMADRGVVNVKCSTTLELSAACEAGAKDVLVAYAMVGAGARRVREIAAQHPACRVSILVENEAQAAWWRGSNIGMFIDVNSGMNRTGIDQAHVDRIVALAGCIGDSLRGLHWYDGHVSAPEMQERERAAHKGYDHLMQVIAACEQADHRIEEVITSGTPAFPCGLSYTGFRNAKFVHRVSPGTIVYNDFTSLGQLPESYGFAPAALIVATVVSHPLPNVITCNAGHKSVSADAGVPTCQVLGHPGLRPQKPSEEHLPIEIDAGAPAPSIGDTLYLLPRHVCPSVNNFDDALIVERGRISGIESVTARGHESPLAAAAAHS